MMVIWRRSGAALVVSAQPVLAGLALLALVMGLSGCNEEEGGIYGTIERDRLTLIAPTGELITQVNVHEGDKVSAGAVLLTLDDRAAQARVAQRQAQLAQVEASLAELTKGARSEELAQAQAQVAASEATRREAQRRFDRTQQLYRQKVLTQADLDQVRADRDKATAATREAEEKLRELINGTRSEQLAQASAEVDAARAVLEQEQKALSDLTLVAAQAAVVDNLPWRVGDRVAAGTQLIGLLALDRPYVRVYLPASDLHRVKSGTPVLIHAEGFTQSVTGTVRTIRSQPAYTPFYALNERDRARLMYLTDIDLPQGSELPTGLAVEVELPHD